MKLACPLKLKSGTPLPITLEVLNNTSEDKTGLMLELKKVSPDNATEEILAETVALEAGQTLSRSLTIAETLPGAWQLTARLTAGGGGEVPAAEILSETGLVFRVSEAKVKTEITAPAFAGDLPFEMKIKLYNEGDIPVDLAVKTSTAGNNETLLEETLSLAPREQQVFTLDDTIRSDRVYHITLGGDVEKSESKTVRYGYVEQFAVEIQPVYREGPVSIPVSLANNGDLAFLAGLEAELYPAGGVN